MDCPICYERFNSSERRPLILPCGHTVCKICVSRLATRVCPECRQQFQAQVDNLATNLPLMNLAETGNEPLADALGDEASIRFIPANEVAVLSDIGSGATSTVYKAKWGSREVALKLVNVRVPAGPSAPNDTLLEGFMKELRIVHQLSEECHNTCRVYGYTVYDNKPGILLKLYSKGDLQGLIGRDGAMPTARAISTGMKIAAALVEVHRQNIVIADVKPSNILLSDVGDPILADFSISKVISATRGYYTATSVQGTDKYMAPEQSEEGQVSCKADIWAWACVMVHCLSGIEPWAGLNSVQIIRKVIQGETPAIPAGLPHNVAELLKDCFNLDPSCRPSAADLVARLQHAAASTVLNQSVPGEHVLDPYPLIRQPIDAISQGGPLQLLSFDRSSALFRLNTDAADIIKSIHKPLAVVALAGRSRTGKSYLMNRIAGATAGRGFHVAATFTAVTSGLWLWSKPIDMGSHAVILLDTEGMDDTASDAQYDAKLFTLVALVASTLLFNVHRNLDRNSLERLNQVALCSQQVYKSCDMTGRTAEGSELPELHVVVRDWEFYTQHTPREWLEAKLIPDSSANEGSVFDGSRELGNYKEQIAKFFPRRDATVVPYPLRVISEADVQNLENLPSSHFRPEFEQAVRQLINKIHSPGLPQKVLGHDATDGPKLVELLTHYVQAVNNNQCPDIGNGVRAVEHAIGMRAMDLANRKFDDAAKQHVDELSRLSSSGYNDMNALMSRVDQVHLELLQMSLSEFDAHASNISTLMKEKFRFEITERAETSVRVLKHKLDSLMLTYTLRSAQDLNAEQRRHFEDALRSANESHRHATERYQADFADQARRMKDDFEREVRRHQQEANAREQQRQFEQARVRVQHQSQLQEIRQQMDAQIRAAQASAAHDRKLQEEKTQRVIEDSKKKIEDMERRHREEVRRKELEREHEKQQLAAEQQRIEQERQRAREAEAFQKRQQYTYQPTYYGSGSSYSRSSTAPVMVGAGAAFAGIAVAALACTIQ